MFSESYLRLRKTITGMATVIAIGVTILAPTIFGLSAYRSTQQFLNNQAQLVVENIGRYIFLHPEIWVFEDERLAGIVDAFLFTPDIRVEVVSRESNLSLTVGQDPAWPFLTMKLPLVDPAGPTGEVGIAVSFLPALLETFAVFAVSLAMGIGMMVVLRTIPMRALDQNQGRLEQTFKTLEDSESRLREAQRIAKVGAWEIDLEMRQYHCLSDSFCPIELNQDCSVNIASFFDCIHADDRDRIEGVLEALIIGKGSRISDELRIVQKDGEIRYLAMAGELRLDGDGTPQSIGGTFHDVTERRRAEEKQKHLIVELGQASRSSIMGEMASGLAHELNQPLAAISNFASAIRQRLASGLNNPADMEKASSLISEQVSRANETIRKIRWLVGEPEPVKRVVDINDIMSDAVALIRDEANEHSITIRMVLGDDLPSVIVDPIQIVQVVVNLARNGIEAMASVAQDRELVFDTRREYSSIHVRVIDTGPGIPEEIQPYLYFPFVSSKPGAMGTGLLICRRIVHDHDGEFYIGDRKEGGVEASFTLPIAGPDETALTEGGSF
jgi:signal transduction histidine kinase